jgi:uncharacterized protein
MTPSWYRQTQRLPRRGARGRRGAGGIVVAVAIGIVLGSGAAGTGSVARAELPLPAAPSRWVTDNSGFLSPAAAHELDARLQDYETRTGRQFVVFIDRTTGGVPIEDWAVRAFKAWGIGRRGKDDGLALFIFSGDHHLRFEVGYGLEALLTDARAARIIEDIMVPRIRGGDRDGAVRGGVEAAVEALGGAPESKGKRPAAQAPPEESHGVGFIGVLITLAALFLFLRHPVLGMLGLMNIGPPGWRSRRWGGGGGSFFDGGGGGFGGGGGGGGGGFSGGGGSSGGGGASGSW